MSPDIARPPFDPELAAALSQVGEQLSPTITPDMIEYMRSVAIGGGEDELETLLGERQLEREDVSVPGHDGAQILLTVVRRRDHSGLGPGIYHTHGGGMIIGDRFVGVGGFLDAIVRHDAVFVTVEYRLAPEHPDPTPVEDCYAGLVWVGEHAAELGIDENRLMIAGGSAGGGLAAGTALLARDRGGPKLFAQMLLYPMIDDRDATVSSRQIDGVGVWDRGSNVTGWSALLGDRRGGPEVSIYAAPARATDLTGLPPTFIDCGSAEVFRDEDVAYASALWAAGVQAELHVWAGGFHAFESFAPHAAVSQAAVAARENWLDRILGN